MIVIADTNIVVSALISPRGNIASIFKEKSNMQFIAPNYMLLEIYNHWHTIIQSTSLSTENVFAELEFY